MLTFEDTDICRVTNTGDNVVTLKWNGRIWKVKPDQSAVVPINAAILAFGDPRSIKTIRSWKSPITKEVGWVPDRAAEVRRIRTKYAIHSGSDSDFTDASGEIPANVPKVEVEFMDGGEFVPIQTVLDDPHGEGAYLEESNSVDIATLQASLEKTQRQLAMLIAKTDGDIGLGDEDDIPMDDPSETITPKVPVKK